MYYLNKNIKDLDRVFDQHKRRGYLRLDLNENPTGLPQSFINKVLKGVDAEFISQYPETLEFTETLADAMFEVYSKMYGRNFIPIKYTDDLKIDIKNVLEKMTSDVELIIIVNPNNPIGNAFTNAEMEKIIDKAKENEITVLIDEAYYYFYDNTFINYALENDHIFLTRTFSKLFSLAGCRLGYVVGWPEGIKMIQKLCTPHNVNAFGMRFAKAIIEEPNMIQELIDKHKEGREYLIDFLSKNNYSFSALNGNFMFIKPKTDPELLVKRMKNEKHILIKVYNGIGNLGECLRVTTGEKSAMTEFIDALKELDN